MGRLRDLFRKRQTDHGHGHDHDHTHPKGTDPGREREREAPAQTFYKNAAGASRSTLSLNLVRDLMLRTRRGEQVDKGEDEQDGGRVERLSMASWVTGESEHDLVGPPTSDQGALDDRNAQRQDEQDGVTIRSSSSVSSVDAITRGRLTACNDERYQAQEDAGLIVNKASHHINTRRAERSNQSSTVQYSMASAPATQSAQSDQDHPSIMAEDDENDESSVETSHSPVTATSDSPRSSRTNARQRQPIAQRTPTPTETPQTPPAASPHELPAIEPFSPLRNSMAHLLSDRFGTHPSSTMRPHGHQAATSDYGLAMPWLSSGTGTITPSATTKPDSTTEYRAISTTKPSRSTRPAPPTHSSLPLPTASKHTRIASSSPTSATGLTHDNNGYNQGQREEHSRRIRELERALKSTKQDWEREQQGWKMVSRDQNEVIQMQKEEIEALKYGRQRPDQHLHADPQDRSQSRVWDDQRAAAGAREDQWQLPHQDHRYDYGNPSRPQQCDGDMRGPSRVDRLAKENEVYDLSTVDEVSEFSESDEHVE